MTKNVFIPKMITVSTQCLDPQFGSVTREQLAIAACFMKKQLHSQLILANAVNK